MKILIMLLLIVIATLIYILYQWYKEIIDLKTEINEANNRTADRERMLDRIISKSDECLKDYPFKSSIYLHRIKEIANEYKGEK